MGKSFLLNLNWSYRRLTWKDVRWSITSPRIPLLPTPDRAESRSSVQENREVLALNSGSVEEFWCQCEHSAGSQMQSPGTCFCKLVDCACLYTLLSILVIFKSLAAVTMHIEHHIMTSMSVYNLKNGYSDMSFPTAFWIVSIVEMSCDNLWEWQSS